MSIPYYTGATAANYDAKRTKQPEWGLEEAAIRRLLEMFVPCSILDVPCGTGRFHAMYRDLGAEAVGLDISHDMLRQARDKGMCAEQGDILALGDRSCDVAVCIRLANWLSDCDLVRALKELRRVSARAVIVGVQLSVVGGINVGGARTHGHHWWMDTVTRCGLTVDAVEPITVGGAYRYLIFRLGVGP